jgi:DNA-binding transcriptional regulator YiaG
MSDMKKLKNGGRTVAMSTDRAAPVGKELVRRLKRFASALETTEKLESRFTCRTVKLNLKSRRYGPTLVKETRSLLHASQPIFAQFLGVSPSAVRDWEQGVKPPSGSACRLMDEIRQNPEYFFGRLKELSVTATSE